MVVFFCSLFLAPKIKYCLTINEYGIVEERKIFKGFGDVNRLLDTKKYFDMQEGKKVIGTFPLSWKKVLKTVVIYHQKKEIVKIVMIKFCVKIVN